MPDAQSPPIDAYRDICFVIMPFGTKTVGSGDAAREIDFDVIYDVLFKPAIEAVPLPRTEGGGHLRAVRTDRDFYSGDISQEMFQYLEYARFALADITGLNANVFYELGARHRAHESGTAIFRQGEALPPFDIAQIKAFPYTVDPLSQLEKSKQLVSKVLTDSLATNAWDSPIRRALSLQMSASEKAEEAGQESIEDVLEQAENALRREDLKSAHELWIRASELDPSNPIHDLKASDYPKRQGDWDTVIALMHAALAKEAKLDGDGEHEDSTYSDAYRELGIAQNKKDLKSFPRAGEESLQRAVKLAPGDFDAWASLGGILRKAGAYEEALVAYDKAVEVSRGHPYPLLQQLKIRAKLRGEWTLDAKATLALGEAKGFRFAQVSNNPPIDVPWSFFDLAEISLYLGKKDEALEIARRGLKLCDAEWMPTTFRTALEMLPETEALPGLEELKAAAAARAEELRAT